MRFRVRSLCENGSAIIKTHLERMRRDGPRGTIVYSEKPWVQRILGPSRCCYPGKARDDWEIKKGNERLFCICRCFLVQPHPFAFISDDASAKPDECPFHYFNCCSNFIYHASSSIYWVARHPRHYPYRDEN